MTYLVKDYYAIDILRNCHHRLLHTIPLVYIYNQSTAISGRLMHHRADTLSEHLENDDAYDWSPSLLNLYAIGMLFICIVYVLYRKSCIVYSI